MEIKDPLICPECQCEYFEIKREATYVYTYKINTMLTGDLSHEGEPLPFLFDNRELVDGSENLICKGCGAKFPCKLDFLNNKINFTIIQKAIRSDLVEEPEFFG